ncbi:LPXTG cell wall anchor domain-containing protein [Listeria sp. PSOL-1]|uniref:LPXTG cell wall anchor domain-containing protein n=1 Tax=Listeria sp. PSOL-1 TaxID=1844999 RepID=UPI0013D06A62|nr:LPXTG cell wall anchor domain-containing protein [Listeria sp. PSOL-1]
MMKKIQGCLFFFFLMMILQVPINSLAATSGHSQAIITFDQNSVPDKKEHKAPDKSKHSKNKKAKKSTSKIKKLPQTGENTLEIESLIGFFLLLTLLYLYKNEIKQCNFQQRR